MQPFTQLESNVKGAVNIDLGPLTCIVGGNQVGKSSHLDTIRLAITGKHPVGANPSDLVELLPPNADRLYARLRSSDGSLAWDMTVDEGRPRRSAGVQGHGVFQGLSADERQSMLVLDQGNFLSFGAERMRRTVMQRFGDLDEVQPPAGLNPDQLALWRDAQLAATGDPSQQLTSMQKWFKTTAKKRGDAARTLEDVVTRLGAHVQDIGGADVLKQIEERLQTALAFEAGMQARRTVEQIDERLTSIDARREQLRGHEVEGDRQVLASLRISLTGANEGLTNADILEKLIDRAQGACPVCGSTNVELDVLREDIAKGRATRKQQRTETLEAIAVIEGRLPDHELAELASEQTRLEQQRRTLQQQLPSTYTGPDSAELQRQCAQIRDVLATRERITRETEQMHRLLDEQATAKLLERQVTAMLNAYLHAVKGAAETAVNRYMPEGFRAELRITDKVCEWRMLGADGRSHKSGAYSGSEGGNLLIALAQAWAEDAPFRLVLLDDIDLGVFDPSRLRQLFNKFEELVRDGHIDQVIMVWNRPHEVPESWHIVSLGE